MTNEKLGAEQGRERKPRNRWWLSWVQTSEDFRPLAHPPNKDVLGWWCSGYDADDNAILCAAVIGSTERDAKKAIAKDWPESKTANWRFCRLLESLELSDRFPLDSWAKERFAQEAGR
jgi:hypothetical protein